MIDFTFFLYFVDIVGSAGEEKLQMSHQKLHVENIFCIYFV